MSASFDFLNSSNEIIATVKVDFQTYRQRLVTKSGVSPAERERRQAIAIQNCRLDPDDSPIEMPALNFYEIALKKWDQAKPVKVDSGEPAAVTRLFNAQVLKEYIKEQNPRFNNFPRRPLQLFSLPSDSDVVEGGPGSGEVQEILDSIEIKILADGGTDPVVKKLRLERGKWGCQGVEISDDESNNLALERRITVIL